MRMKPTHCSKVLAPRRGTFCSCFRLVNRPFSSRNFTMFLAVVAFTPATYCRSDGDAVLRSTPTWFTADSTTPFRLSSSRFC
ncbi:hypothetical protein D3C86_2136680 [compost metagenome]